MWKAIKEALSPSWAARMPAPTREDEAVPPRNEDEKAQNTATPKDSSNFSSSPSSGTTETAEGTSTSPAIPADRTNNEVALAANEEVRTKYLGEGFQLKSSVSVERARSEHEAMMAVKVEDQPAGD